MLFAETVGSNKQDYKYNGKELDLMHGLNHYDYSARQYDPARLQFTTVDPLAESSYAWSPYAYVLNNPLLNIDPTGMVTINGNEVSQDFFMQWWNSFLASFGLGERKLDASSPEEAKQDVAYNEAQSDKLKKTAETVDAVNETILDFVPFGEMGYNAYRSKDVTWGDVGWSVASIIPVGKITKKGKPIVNNVLNTIISNEDYLRIQNAATRINKPIHVVGSRASGTAGVLSDWDYIIEGISSKEWSKIKNSLPGSGSILDNTSRNIDLIKTPLNKTKPYISIKPRAK